MNTNNDNMNRLCVIDYIMSTLLVGCVSPKTQREPWANYAIGDQLDSLQGDVLECDLLPVPLCIRQTRAA